MHIILLFFVVPFISFAGPWTTGQMPNESYRYRHQEGHSAWTNYIHKLALRSEATRYSSKMDGNPSLTDKWLSEPYTVRETQPYVLGYVNFETIKTNLVYTNLSYSANNITSTTLNISWENLNYLDAKLIESLQHYVDVDTLSSNGGVSVWLDTHDNTWVWTIINSNLWECNGQPIARPEDCEIFDGAYRPDEAFAWRNVPVRRTDLPMLTITSAWEKLNLPITKSIQTFTNYTKTVYGWEVGMLDDYTVEYTYPVYVETNVVYGFSVTPTVNVLTQILAKAEYSLDEELQLKLGIKVNIDGDMAEVVTKGRKVFNVSSSNNFVSFDGLYKSRNYITNSFFGNGLFAVYTFPITNEKSNVTFSEVAFSGVGVTDQFKTTTNNISGSIGSATKYSANKPFGVSSDYPVILITNISGSASVSFTRTLTNYYRADSLDFEIVWRDTFDSMPKWNVGIAGLEIYTVLANGYSVIIASTNRQDVYPPDPNRYNAKYLNITDQSHTNYLNERMRVLSLMTSTRTYGNVRAAGISTTPSLHYAYRTFPNSGIYGGDGRIYPDMWYEGAYPQDTPIDGDVYCSFYRSKRITKGSIQTVSRLPTRPNFSTNFIYTVTTPSCATNQASSSVGVDPRVRYIPFSDWVQKATNSIRGMGKLMNTGLGFSWSGIGPKASQTFGLSSYSKKETYRFGDLKSSSTEVSEDFEGSATVDVGEILNTGAASVTISNLTTNISCSVEQYASFATTIDRGSPITNFFYTAFENGKNQFSGNDDCVSTNRQVELEIQSDPPISTNSSFIKYVGDSQKELNSDHAIFGYSDYGLGGYVPDGGWFRQKDIIFEACSVNIFYTLDNGFGSISDFRTGTMRVFWPRYWPASRALDKMLFVMNWNFDGD